MQKKGACFRIMIKAVVFPRLVQDFLDILSLLSFSHSLFPSSLMKVYLKFLII